MGTKEPGTTQDTGKKKKKTDKPNYSGRLPEGLDPDKMVLTKKDVLEIIDLILKQWKTNSRENWKFIFGLRAIKTGILMQPEGVVQKIWSALLGFVNEVSYEFTIRNATRQEEAWAQALGHVKKRIKVEGVDLSQ